MVREFIILRTGPRRGGVGDSLQGGQVGYVHVGRLGGGGGVADMVHGGWLGGVRVEMKRRGDGARCW